MSVSVVRGRKSQILNSSNNVAKLSPSDPNRGSVILASDVSDSEFAESTSINEDQIFYDRFAHLSNLYSNNGALLKPPEPENIGILI